jgi:hypothetical protein
MQEKNWHDDLVASGGGRGDGGGKKVDWIKGQNRILRNYITLRYTFMEFSFMKRFFDSTMWISLNLITSTIPFHVLKGMDATNISYLNN